MLSFHLLSLKTFIYSLLNSESRKSCCFVSLTNIRVLSKSMLINFLTLHKYLYITTQQVLNILLSEIHPHTWILFHSCCRGINLKKRQVTHLQIMLHGPSAAATIANWKTSIKVLKAANTTCLIGNIGQALNKQKTK